MRIRNPFAAQHRELTDRDVALRLLWSDEITAVDELTGELVVDEDTVAWVGEVLGLNTTTPEHSNDVTPQQRHYVNA